MSTKKYIFPTIDAKAEIVKLEKDIKNWFDNYSGNAKGVVIGISGGKDSTIVATLCQRALGKDKVFGLLMPNGLQEDIEDAIEVCEFLGIKYKVLNIKRIYNAFLDSFFYSADFQYNEMIPVETKELSDHTKTNISPRIRMASLYAFAQEHGYRVVGTGNACERFVGYFTKWGDSGCDYNPISRYSVSQLLDIGDELGIADYLVHKTPADGVSGKTDEDNLGFTYDMLERYMYNGTTGDIKLDIKIADKHKYAKHKFILP